MEPTQSAGVCIHPKILQCGMLGRPSKCSTVAQTAVKNQAITDKHRRRFIEEWQGFNV